MVWAGWGLRRCTPILTRPPFRFPADPPKQVLLTLSPTSVAVGTLFTIECRVPAVAPLECLTVTLLRGTEILCNQTFVGTTLSPQDAVVTHNSTAHREDGLYNFSCEAQMDLRSRGDGLVHRVSDPQRLEVKGEGEPTDQEGMHSLSAPLGKRTPLPHSLPAQGRHSGKRRLIPGVPSSSQRIRSSDSD